MSGLLIDLAVLLLVSIGGTAFLWWSRLLEKRIFSIERSLGAFADLGAGGDEPLGNEQVLRHLEAVTRSMMAETETTEASTPKPAEER